MSPRAQSAPEPASVPSPPDGASLPPPLSPPDDPPPAERRGFVHPAEAEFARLLDFYGVAWLYEPQEFPLEWDGARVTRQFRPDFYLPEYNLYIELTVMKQSLVRRKNRKLRLLRALYPQIRIKLLYRRDVQRLLAGFGLPGLDAPAPGATQDAAA